MIIFHVTDTKGIVRPVTPDWLYQYFINYSIGGGSFVAELHIKSEPDMVHKWSKHIAYGYL